jgi:hypothetical protein
LHHRQAASSHDLAHSIAHLEHFAAASPADTLQLGVPCALHVYSLSIFSGPRLLPLLRCHGLLLLLLKLLSLLLLLLLLLLLQLLLGNCPSALLLLVLLLPPLLLLLLLLPCISSGDRRRAHALLSTAAVVALARVCWRLRGAGLGLRLQRPAGHTTAATQSPIAQHTECYSK